MNIGRYQFIWWDTLAYEPWEAVTGCALACVYDRAGRWGHFEIRRFVKRPATEGSPE